MNTQSELAFPRRASLVRLSKSKFLAGLQCPKRLYLEVHHPELATEPDEQTQAILDMGTLVGELARQRFPGGVLVEADHRHAKDALRRTAELLADPSVPAIFEGAIEYEDVLVRVDILERIAGPDGASAWRLIEVKSSTRVKDVHVDDLAIQSYVLRGAGLTVSGACLMHVNTQYVYDGGDLDLEMFFTVGNVTERILGVLADVPGRLQAMRATLATPAPPAIEPDGHCHTPYECPFWTHCTEQKPARWIYFLPGGDRTFRHLAARGIITIDEIPSDARLTVVQRRVKDNVEWVSSGLKSVLTTVRYPVHHLDFETFMPAIPRFPQTRPYQPIPTQWSNHVETEDGTVVHHEYLCGDPKDPREELAVALLESVGREGTVCVYSSFERHILESLVDAVPSLKRELEVVMARLWDLHQIIKDHYYHPAFQGSYSIKAVLPALVPSLDYGDLAIQDGGVAALHYYRMVFEETDLVERARISEALLKYCARDTQAMLELRRVLLEKANGWLAS
jgi:hypothetical protein